MAEAATGVAILVILMIFWILCGIGAGIAASNKGRSGCGWFILGILLGPFGILFAVLVAPVSPMVTKQATPTPAPSLPKPNLSDETKICPACAETIKLAATKCRYCGERFDADQVTRDLAAHEEELAPRQEKIRCPVCGFWEVKNVPLPDGRYGFWCFYCRKPMQIK